VVIQVDLYSVCTIDIFLSGDHISRVGGKDTEQGQIGVVLSVRKTLSVYKEPGALQ
jgi:hypothetical protein